MNTRGWVLSELLDHESALRLNIDAIQAARELADVEAECNGHINSAHDYLALGEPDRAWEHLREAEARCAREEWCRWIYLPRLNAEVAHYWITRGDLSQARSRAGASLEQAGQTQSRKRLAWAHKLLGDIAALEDRVEEARREFGAALDVLKNHPCPILEWQILVAAAAVRGAARDELSGRARAVIRTLAASIPDDALRNRFLHAKPLRDLL